VRRRGPRKSDPNVSRETCPTCWRAVGGGAAGWAAHTRSKYHLTWFFHKQGRGKQTWKEAAEAAEEESKTLWERYYQKLEKDPAYPFQQVKEETTRPPKQLARATRQPGLAKRQALPRVAAAGEGRSPFRQCLHVRGRRDGWTAALRRQLVAANAAGTIAIAIATTPATLTGQEDAKAKSC